MGMVYGLLSILIFPVIVQASIPPELEPEIRRAPGYVSPPPCSSLDMGLKCPQMAAGQGAKADRVPEDGDADHLAHHPDNGKTTAGPSHADILEQSVLRLVAHISEELRALEAALSAKPAERRDSQ